MQNRAPYDFFHKPSKARLGWLYVCLVLALLFYLGMISLGGFNAMVEMGRPNGRTYLYVLAMFMLAGAVGVIAVVLTARRKIHGAILSLAPLALMGLSFVDLGLGRPMRENEFIPAMITFGIPAVLLLAQIPCLRKLQRVGSGWVFKAGDELGYSTGHGAGMTFLDILPILGSVAAMVAGLALMDQSVGKGLFAAGVFGLGVSAKRMWLSRNREAIADFAQLVQSSPDLAEPKRITVVSKNPVLKDFLAVSLNGELVGQVNIANTCTFTVTKQRNVVSLPGGRKSSCFFEVTDQHGVGELEVKMGMVDPLLVIKEGTGLKAI